MTHGLSKHPLYSVHQDMLKRCNNPNSQAYKWYGARGITVCPLWYDFVTFFLWALPLWKKGLTIDRINNDKGYSPTNCKFSTRAEQVRNRDCSVKLTIDGVTRCVTEWAEDCELTPDGLIYRMKLNRYHNEDGTIRKEILLKKVTSPKEVS